MYIGIEFTGNLLRVYVSCKYARRHQLGANLQDEKRKARTAIHKTVVTQRPQKGHILRLKTKSSYVVDSKKDSRSMSW